VILVGHVAPIVIEAHRKEGLARCVGKVTGHRCGIRGGVAHPHVAQEVLRCRPGSVSFHAFSRRAEALRRLCPQLEAERARDFKHGAEAGIRALPQRSI
jgi:hypothetical protein